MAVDVSSMAKNKGSRFLRNKRDEYLALRNKSEMVPTCYQNMSLEREVFFDHKPLCNNLRKLPKSKISKKWKV